MSRSTHAWVLSGGTNTGAMKLVGEAVTEGQFLVPQGAGRLKLYKNLVGRLGRLNVRRD